jgi:hypothetical protein
MMTAFPLSAIATHFEGTKIHKLRGSHCKSDKNTDRCIEKWFPGMFPKVKRMLVKVCHCPREIL